MAKAEKAAIDKAPDSGASVGAIDFNGLLIPVDALFVSPGMTRHVELGDGVVFMFLADEPRQLPPAAIVPCLAQGIQIVK